MRDELDKRYSRYAFDGSERVSWKRAVISWGEHAPSSLKPRSFERYRLSLKAVRDWLDPLYLDEIDRKMMAKIAHRSGVSNTTRRRDLTAVSSVLDHAIAMQWIDENVARQFDRRSIKEKRDPFTEPLAQDIAELHAAGPAMWAAAMKFARASGMREEEIFSLERSQFREDGIQLTRTKTSSPRLVPWLPGMRDIVDALPVFFDCPYVFWHEVRNPDGTVTASRYRNLASQYNRIKRQANAKRRDGRPIAHTFHGFRHLFAIEYLRREGRDRLPTLSEILGHDSIKTTEWYLKYVSPEGTTEGTTSEKAPAAGD